MRCDGSLADIIKSQHEDGQFKPLGIPFILDLVRQIVDALQAFDDIDFVHQDGKPGNILYKLHDGVPFFLMSDYGLGRNNNGDIRITGRQGTAV